MSTPFLLGTDYLRKIQSVRPQNLVSLWPQNEPLGHAVSTEVVRGYDGAYTAVTLGQPGVPGSGLTSAGYDGATSFNNIYSAGFANDNALLNPGFETPGAMPPTWANWVDFLGDGAIANEVVIVHEGVDAAKLTAGPLRNTTTGQSIVVVPGTRERLRLWSYGTGAVAARYYVYDVTNGAYIIPYGTSTGQTAAAWGMTAVQFTVPAGCVSVGIFLQCSDTNGTSVYFDACEVRRMDGFLGDQGTILLPAQVANAGVWTDGALRRVCNIRVDAANRIIIGRTFVNNEISFNYISGGINEFIVIGGLTTTDFMYLGLTWDKAADAVMAYYNGIQTGLTQTIGGTWVGDLLATSVAIGAENTVPINVWSGNIAPLSVWSDRLSPDEMRYTGT